jgi:very-short-patch-repair endonuclease
MGSETPQRTGSRVWALAEGQHGLVTRAQLIQLGFSRQAIEHRIAKRRLHPVRRGVYALGRPQLSRYGHWMAAILSCGPRAILSHASAAALWELGSEGRGEIEVSVPTGVDRRRPGIRVHRRAKLEAQDLARHHAIPVTSPTLTLVDLATRLGPDELEAAINAADKRDLVDPESLRSALEEIPRRPGVARLRRTLDRRTFTLTDSQLERRFLPIARRAGLPLPRTRQRVNGFRVDFCWPELGLVVETDGLRYHRTPAQQARDRLRDQTHSAAGLTPLRFTRAQVRLEPGHVEATLAAVVRRLRADGRAVQSPNRLALALRHGARDR